MSTGDKTSLVNHINSDDAEKLPRNLLNDRLFGGLFLAGVAGAAFLFGFGRSFAASKKTERLVDSGEAIRIQANTLALRALGWGSVIALAGVGTFCFAIWKATGAKNMNQFREVVGNALPRIPKTENPEARTQFRTLTELLQYIIDEDEKKTKFKKNTGGDDINTTTAKPS